MANTTRAEDLVHAMEQDPTFQSEVQTAPTIKAKQAVLEQHGFGDVTLDDMKAYVESQGGTIVARKGGEELSEQELEAVAGGLTDDETLAMQLSIVVAAPVAAAAAAA